MPFVYILRCSDGTYYTGSAVNLERRLWQHETGIGPEYTHTRLPVECVYREFYNSIKDAYLRERQIHRWSHIKKDALISGTKADLKEKAKKKFGK